MYGPPTLGAGFVAEPPLSACCLSSSVMAVHEWMRSPCLPGAPNSPLAHTCVGIHFVRKWPRMIKYQGRK